MLYGQYLYKMYRYCTITPTRGDREELLNFSLSRLPEELVNIVVDYPPTSDDVDLVPRIKEGIRVAQELGFDYVFILEDDDYYPVPFFEFLNEMFQTCDPDFFGYQDTRYYNLKNRTYNSFTHFKRSSLFSTGFKISALKDFRWPPDKEKFLDIRLWEYANDHRFRIILNGANPCIGIKHGLGKCAGKGHSMILENTDPDFKYLKKSVDDHAYAFYMDLIKTL